MPVTVERIALMRDGFTAEMDWNDDIIGLNVNGINIRIEASGEPLAQMPDTIRVNVTSRVANRDAGVATIPPASPLVWDVPRFGPDPADASRTFYQTSRSIWSAGFFLARDDVLEVATVVRPGGSSDALFRRALVGWTVRGRSTQPTTVVGRTGSSLEEIPDAFTLLQAAGVEVLSITLVPVPGQIVLSSEGKGLIRNPANIVYYSGHGKGSSNCLAIEVPGIFTSLGFLETTCWMGPSDLTPHWQGLADLDVFIIAGCSVLKIDFPTFFGSPSGPGLAWSKLLAQKGGPLQALLGYGASAPKDTGAGTPGAIDVGNTIATEMGIRITGGSLTFVKDWLEVNAAHKAWNAVGMDGQGYWTIEAKREMGFLWHTGSFNIQGPRSIP
jgi:hypothetical protein